MELHKAIKKILESYGVDILHDHRLLNILNDYKAFEEVPASKYILRDIVAEGILEKMSGGKYYDDVELFIKNTVSDVVSKYGYIPDFVDYSLASVAYALQLTKRTPSLAKTSYTENHVQKEEGHISFKGISFSEDLRNFVKKLLKSGFITDKWGRDRLDKKTFNPGAISFSLEGPFAGINWCKIYVLSSWLTHAVTKVSVIFPVDLPIKREEWEDVKSRYLQLKNKLTEKYGIPIPCSNTVFAEPVLDGFENDMEESECLYEIDYGSIRLSWYALVYEDKANMRLDEIEKNADL